MPTAEKTITMRMARASDEDQQAMFLLTGILSDVYESSSFNFPDFPRGLDGEFDPEAPDHFDEDNPEHLRALHERLKHIFDHHCGAMRRVVWGYNTLTLPSNRLIDPEADHLAFHPRIEAMETALREAWKIIDRTAPNGRPPEAAAWLENHRPLTSDL